MKWFTAILIGALIAFVLPLAFGGMGGPWRESWAGVGTIAPIPNNPGLLFSIPAFLISAVGLRMFFNWHSNG